MTVGEAVDKVTIDVNKYKEDDSANPVLLLPTASSAILRQAIKSLDEFIDTKESNKNSTKP